MYFYLLTEMSNNPDSDLLHTAAHTAVRLYIISSILHFQHVQFYMSLLHQLEHYPTESSPFRLIPCVGRVNTAHKDILLF